MIASAAGVFALVLGASSTQAQVIRLGAMGDSLTDEYSEQAYSYAQNWTMQIVTYRGVNMGPTAVAAAQPGGTWGEPRRAGYASNWARYGADSSSALTDGQHTGLASQVSTAPGGVSHVVLAIGANDFSPSTGAYFNLYFGLWSQNQIDAYVNAQLADIRTVVQTLQPTGAGIVLCNYVDFGIAPVTRGIYSNGTLRNRVTAVINRVNAGVELIAQENHVVLVDLNAMGTALFGTNTALKQFLKIGNVDIQLFNRDTTSHTAPLAGFVDDGAHPHTSVQGVFANLMMSALNAGWGGGASGAYSMFTDQEILAHAGIAYGGAETLNGQIPPYSQFIRSYTCPVVTSPPASVTTCGSETAQFGVGALGGGTITYTWQWRPLGTSSWMNVVNGPNVDPAHSGVTAFVATGAGQTGLSLFNGASIGATAGSVRREIRAVATNTCGGVPSVSSLWTIVGMKCQPADIADDAGSALPPFSVCDVGLTNTGVNEGDYNAFFQGFFDAAASCDIADDAGTALPPFSGGNPVGTNTGVNEGDYNCFFQFFFVGCP